MAYRLRVSHRAVQEIGDAYEWYEEQLYGLGVEFIDALDVQLQLKSRNVCSRNSKDATSRSI